MHTEIKCAVLNIGTTYWCVISSVRPIRKTCCRLAIDYDMNTNSLIHSVLEAAPIVPFGALSISSGLNHTRGNTSIGGTTHSSHGFATLGTGECPNGFFPFSTDNFLWLIADGKTALINIVNVLNSQLK